MADDERPGTAVEQVTGRGALRVSHDDRDQVAEALRIAAGDGRLTADELDERLEQALTARTYADLTVLVADLPAAPGAGISPVRAKEQASIESVSSATKRDGRWAVPARLRLSLHSGTVTLDFTEAVLSYPELHIDADLHSSVLTLVTRPGISVETDDVTMHSSTLKVPPPDGGAPPLLRVVISGACYSSAIRARPPRPPRTPRRTFWQWLRRAPRRRAITA